MKANTRYDVIIVGGSYAGLAAGMALGRALRKVLIIDSDEPCNAFTPYSHNFLTSDGKTPAEITAIAKQQLLQYDTVSLLNNKATSAKKITSGFEVETGDGKLFAASKLVFATGIRDEMLPIPGFAACWGKTVIHCPYCHGYEVRNQKTGILANGETAYDLSILISNWTNDLSVYTNGHSTLSAKQVVKLQDHRINIVESEISSLEHLDGNLQFIRFRDGSIEPLSAIYTRPQFEQHSGIPETLGCELNAAGYIKVDPMQKTTIDGVFACGDNTSRFRTVAGAVSQGTLTGMMVNKELIEENF